MQTNPETFPLKGVYPPFPEGVPPGAIDQGPYRLRFATSAAELDAVLRLRFRVFNLEMGEGLESSWATGKDEDAFDRTCHHLLVEDRRTSTTVGTYRIQTSTMAAAGGGFYSAGEFDLSTLPPVVVTDAVEVGRACIAPEHRHRQVLFLLWKGLARYLSVNRRRFLFGCCSLTTQDPCDGARALAHLAAGGHLHPEVSVPPLPGLECDCPRQPTREEAVAVTLPALFRTYLRYGSKVCGPPAIDREFKTIDFLVLLDVATLDERRRAIFFGDAEPDERGAK